MFSQFFIKNAYFILLNSLCTIWKHNNTNQNHLETLQYVFPNTKQVFASNPCSVLQLFQNGEQRKTLTYMLFQLTCRTNREICSTEFPKIWI